MVQFYKYNNYKHSQTDTHRLCGHFVPSVHTVIQCWIYMSTVYATCVFCLRKNVCFGEIHI